MARDVSGHLVIATVRAGDHELLYVEPSPSQEPGIIEYHIGFVVQIADVEPSPSLKPVTIEQHVGIPTQKETITLAVHGAVRPAFAIARPRDYRGSH